MKPIRTIFFGTPEFAASALEALLANPRLQVAAVVTQPDRPTGRKKLLAPPPVKILAQARGLEVFQPENLKDEKVQDEILATGPELAVVVAYGNLIPKRMLAAVSRGFVNIHPSLLPKHRGAAPITATILSGDKEAGVCLMLLDELMDHGPVISCRKLALDGTETSASLRAKLAPIAAEILGSDLSDFLDGKIAPQSQDHGAATFCKQIESADARIDWSKGAQEIGRLVRAMHGVTPAWTTLDGKTLLIHEASIVPRPQAPAPGNKAAAGTLIESDKKPAALCADGCLLIEEIQPAGGKTMDGRAFLNGHRDSIGKTLI